jgi:hypothetical protein
LDINASQSGDRVGCREIESKRKSEGESESAGKREDRRRDGP